MRNLAEEVLDGIDAQAAHVALPHIDIPAALEAKFVSDANEFIAIANSHLSADSPPYEFVTSVAGALKYIDSVHSDTVVMLKEIWEELAGRNNLSDGVRRVSFTALSGGIPNAVVVRAPQDGSVAVGYYKCLDGLLFPSFALIVAFATGHLDFDSFLRGFITNIRVTVTCNASATEQRWNAEMAGRIRDMPEVIHSFSRAIARMANEFVLSHEIAHIVLGHFDRVDGFAHSERVDAAISKFKHQLEFEADAWAAEQILDLSTYVEDQEMYRRFAPALYFRLWASIDTLCSRTMDVDRSSMDTHPSSIVRAERLLPSKTLRHIDAEKWELCNGFYSGLETMEQAINTTDE